MDRAVGNLETAQLLRALLWEDGESLTYEQVLMHLGEDGGSCTRAEYEAAWDSLHGGEDVKTGRRKRPPGYQGAGMPLPQPREESVSETNGTNEANAPSETVNRLGNIESTRRLREIMGRLGLEASAAAIREAAMAAGLSKPSDAAINRGRDALWPDRPRKPGGSGPAKVTPARAASPAPLVSGPDPSGDLLASVQQARQRLADLKRTVEAAGGRLTYTMRLSFEVKEG